MNAENIVIGRREFAIEMRMIPQQDLKFYVENPRVYCALTRETGHEPTQEEIEALLCGMEHVKQLKNSIYCNGGLIEPIFVLDGSLTVLEGNSRLAAYRLLAQEAPEVWGEIPCRVLPADMDESAIFSLLGQYHIIGRKDWEPFEQANYLYRRQQQTGLSIQAMASELGISTQKANKYVQTIEFMIHHDDLNEKHFGSYDKYLKDSALKKVRETEKDLDKTVVEAVKNEDAKASQEVRMLKETARVAAEGDDDAQKVLKEIASGAIDIRDGHSQIENSGKLENVVQKLRRFNRDINAAGFENQLLTLENTEELISRIDRIIERLLEFKEQLGIRN
ncbi:MAG: ParB N-terminal domain-containing protein [Proteobacteria bacterium]|nr:ParB N-terminal domain-containing protein [Pseudomonadota bacterium]